MNIEHTEKQYEQLLEIQALLFSSLWDENSIKKALEIIGRAENADRAFIGELLEGSTFKYAFEWCRKGISEGLPKNAEYDMEQLFPMWLSELKEGHIVNYMPTHDVEQYSSVGYEMLTKDKVEGTYLAPIFDTQQGLIAYVGVDNPRKGVREDMYLKSIAISFGAMYTNKKHYEEKLQFETQQRSTIMAAQFQDALGFGASTIITSNLTKGIVEEKIIHRTDTSRELIEGLRQITKEGYDPFVKACCTFVTANYYDEYKKTVSRGNLLTCFKEGTREIQMDYEAKYGDRKTHSYRLVILLTKDENSGDIQGLFITKDETNDSRFRLKQVLTTIGDAYSGVYYVNFETNTYVMVKKDGKVLEGSEEKHDYDTNIKEEVAYYVVPEEVMETIRILRREYLEKAFLDYSSVINHDYHQIVNGEQRWYRMQIQPALMENGRTITVVVSFRDIEGEKRAQEAKLIHEKLSQKYSTDSLVTGIVDLTTMEMRIVEKNFRSIGKDRTINARSFLRKYANTYIDVGDREEFLHNFSKKNLIQETSEGKKYSFVMARMNGLKHQWSEYNAEALNEDNNVILVSEFNVNDREERTKEKNLLRKIARSLCEDFYRVMYYDFINNDVFRINLQTAEFERIPNREFSRLVNQDLNKNIHPDDVEKVKNCYSREYIIEKVNAETSGVSTEYREIDSDGHVTKWVRVTVTILMNEENEPLSAVAAFLDITDEKLEADRETLASALAKYPKREYDVVLLVNLDEDSFQVYGGLRKYKTLASNCRKFKQLFDMTLQSATQGDRELYREYGNVTWLRENIFNKGLQKVIVTKSKSNEYRQTFFVPHSTVITQTPYMIVAVKDVTKERKKRAIARRNEEILKLLSEDFVNITVIDISNNSYEIISDSKGLLTQQPQSGSLEEMGKQFKFAMSIENAEKAFSHFDMEKLPDKIFNKNETPTFEVELLNGMWVRTRIMPYQDEERQYAISCSLDVTSDMLRNKQIEENFLLLREKKELGDLLGALSEYYNALYVVDEKTFQSKPIKTPKERLGVLNHSARDCFKAMDEYKEKILDPRYREQMDVFFDNFSRGLPPNTKSEIIFKRIDGIWISLAIYKLAKENHNTIWIFENANERQAANERMELLNEQMAHIGRQMFHKEIFVNLETDVCRVLSFDDNGEISESSGRFEKLRGELLKHISEPYKAQLLYLSQNELISQAINSGTRNYQYEFPVVYEDGNTCYLRCNAFVDIIQGNNYLLVVVQDITKEEAQKAREKKYQESIKEALDAANAASIAKSKFLSNMSHDIRTPMNAIIGMTGIAQTRIFQRKDDQVCFNQVNDCLDKVMLSSRHLLGLINDVLDMSRIESGRMVLSEGEFDLEELSAEISSVIASQAKARAIEFDIQIHGIHHEKLVGDIVRLNQILINILGNSVKFTDAGGKIWLEISELPSNHSNIAIYRFVCKDNGHGMSKEFLPHVFEPFVQERRKTHETYTGTGLGMSITKSIVEMMDGNISVESTIGKGTTTTIEVPISIQETQKGYEYLPSIRTLIVDDDIEICHSTSSALDDFGIFNEWALNGDQAISMVKSAHKRKDDFQLAIVDWKLPDMDGIQVAREIRKVVDDNLPIIVISAYDWSDIEEEARAAGVVSFISKPLFKGTLHRKISELLPYILKTPKCMDEKSRAAKESESFSGLRFMVAEDINMNAEVIQTMLELRGGTVEVVEDGEMAVEMFKKHKQGFYDMIFMDVRMPRMDGRAATREIRKLGTDYARKIPIVAMSADAFAEDIQNSLNAGMNGHIAKPIRLEDVLKYVEKIEKHL